MIDIRYKIGQRIKEIRRERGLSQELLATISNIDRTYINGVENGKRNISIINLDKIINALNISYQAFFDSNYFKSNGGINS